MRVILDTNVFVSGIRANEECMDLVRIGATSSNAILMIGVVLILVGGRNCFLARQLRKRIAEPAGSCYRATRSA